MLLVVDVGALVRGLGLAEPHMCMLVVVVVAAAGSVVLRCSSFCDNIGLGECDVLVGISILEGYSKWNNKYIDR